MAPVPGEAFSEEGDADPLATALVVGTSDLNKSEPVSINENFVASIAGVKFEGQETEDDTYKLMRTSIVVRRANNILWVSIVVMVGDVYFGYQHHDYGAARGVVSKRD